MKYKVLEKCICPFNIQVLCPGEVYEWNVDNYDGITKILFVAMVQNGFIEEIKYEPWKPKDGEEYYFLESTGNIATKTFCRPVSNDRYNLGNVFQTREQAEKTVERLKAFKVLEDSTNGFKPNWDNIKEAKWVVGYDHDMGELDISGTTYFDTGTIVFGSEDEARDSIEKYEEEWLTFLGVE